MDRSEKVFNLEEATIESVHSAIEKGELTCHKLVEMYLERIEKFDKNGPNLNSIIMINPNVLDIADDLDRKFKELGFSGPLHGIPVLLKDNIDTGDMPTTAGSLSLEGVMPEDDASIIKKLKDAGAIILAKTNLHEFAIWGETVSSILGQTLNPYDLSRTPGGSSGGTGAGIAANFGIIGIGTDTINSIRSPASACSLVGLRPTIGLVSRDGVVPYSLTQDTAGPITRTVEDAVKVLDIIAGYDINDSSTAWSKGKIPKSYTKYLNKDGLKRKRIGVLKSFFGNKDIHQEVNEIICKSIEEMRKNGAIIVPIEENIDADRLVKEISIHLYDLKAHLNIYLNNLGSRTKIHSLSDVIASEKYHQGIEENIKTAQTLDIEMPEYNKRLIKRMELRNFIMNIIAEYELDAIVYPHQKIPVVKIGDVQVERNGVIGSVTGFPSCVIPAGFTSPTDYAPIGIPVGIEILAKEWDEPTLIEIAYSFEQATQYRRTPVSVVSMNRI
jgi:Asp-tRNA(Asn)/Glu-tRNA(Gln) amidotransferase A subunit family amidase